MSDARGLRQRAEHVLNRRGPHEPPSSTDMRDLIRELQIYQIELELQNEELRDAQLALEVARHKYFELFDLAPVAYLSLEPDSRVVDANRAAVALLGVELDALRGRRFSRLIDPASTEEFARHCRALLALHSHGACQVELRLAGGTRRDVRVESVGVPFDGGLVFRVALIDVTEVNRLERELRESQKVEAISSLASDVAHEFNNRLMAIVGCAEKTQGLVGPDGEAWGTLEQLKEAALRGLSVTSQMLSFARDDGEEIAELDAAVTASIPLVRQSLGDRARLEVELGAPEVRVRMSVGMVEQVLLTLATNARDSMAHGGTMHVATKLAPGAASAEAEAASAHVVIRCSDDGIGMDPETRARAFEAFFTTKPAGQGVGLGLALVRGVVGRARGRVELSSSPGAGTLFCLHLPLAPQVPARAHVPRAVRPVECHDAVLASARVLVVEDDALIRSTIVHVLTTLGSEVHAAANYEEAVEQMRTRAGSLQLVISDVVLGSKPRGLQVEAEAQRSDPNLRVLFMSAHPAGVLLRNSWLELGLAVLEKPFTSEQLRQAVLRSLLS